LPGGPQRCSARESQRDIGKKILSLDYLVAATVVVFIAWRAFASRRVRHRLPELLRAGAQLVVVRTRAEYATDHASQSRNIPLEEFGGRIQELDP